MGNAAMVNVVDNIMVTVVLISMEANALMKYGCEREW